MMRGTVLVNIGKFVECLEFIRNVFFSELEMAMGGVIEALTCFKEKCEYFSVRMTGIYSVLNGYHSNCFVDVKDCLATQKIGEFESCCEEYISRVFPPTVSETFSFFWLEAETISRYVEHLTAYKKYKSCPISCVGQYSHSIII